MTLSSTPAEKNDPSAGGKNDVGELERRTRPPTDHSSDDVKSEDADADGDDEQEGHERLQAQPSNADSIWVAEHMGLGREIAFIALVCMAQFTTQFGLGATTNILHIIGETYGITDSGKLSWLVAGYSLTVGTFILFSGRLGDAFGYKKMLLIGYAWFALWTLVTGCSVYSSFVLHVFARVLQGIGPAICLPNALAIFGAAYPPGNRKAMAFSLFGATAPVGSIAGTVYSAGWSYLWWPWAYWSMSIGVTLVAIAAYFVIPTPSQRARREAQHQSWQTRVWELDLPGAVTGITALVLINFAWNQAPITGWDNPACITTLILGFVLIPVFFYIELHVAKKPLLPLEAVNGDVAFVLAIVACGWATFGIWYFYLFQIIQQLRHAPPLLTSAYFSPVVISGVIAAVATGFLLRRLSPPIVMTGALIAFLIGIILIATLPPHQIYWGQMFVCLIVMPFGMDMSFPAATIILSDAVKKEHQGIAASLVNTVVNYGISLGLGFAGTVEVNINPGGTSPEAILKGYRAALYLGIGLSVLGLAISLCFLLKVHWRDPKKKAAEEASSSEMEA